MFMTWVKFLYDFQNRWANASNGSLWWRGTADQWIGITAKSSRQAQRYSRPDHTSSHKMNGHAAGSWLGSGDKRARRAGINTATNTIANLTNIVALATKNSVAVTKLWLGFTQTSSPDGNSDFPNFEPWQVLYGCIIKCHAWLNNNGRSKGKASGLR